MLTLRISPPPSRWENFSQLGDYYERALAEVRREPGVVSVALNCSSPFSGIALRYPFWVEGRPVDAGNADEAVFNAISADYFSTLRVPLVRGRAFTAADDPKAAASHPVCIINQALARQLFGETDPLGRRIRTLTWSVRSSMSRNGSRRGSSRRSSSGPAAPAPPPSRTRCDAPIPR